MVVSKLTLSFALCGCRHLTCAHSEIAAMFRSLCVGHMYVSGAPGRWVVINVSEQRAAAFDECDVGCDGVPQLRCSAQLPARCGPCPQRSCQETQVCVSLWRIDGLLPNTFAQRRSQNERGFTRHVAALHGELRVNPAATVAICFCNVVRPRRRGSKLIGCTNEAIDWEV